MYRSLIPLLSTYNGPSYLLHAIETCYALQIPQTNVRVTPVIGAWSAPEVEPYYSQSHLDQTEQIDPDRLFAQLCINVRSDNRLRRFLPMVAVGLPTLAQIRDGDQRNRTLRETFERCYRTLDDSDWTNIETPTERLTRQLCAQFPELLTAGTTFEKASKQILVVRSGRFEERERPENAKAAAREIDPDRPQQYALKFVELFFTQAFFAIAAADMMGGFSYQISIEPEGRSIGVEITADSDVRQVVRWLQTYPHKPIKEIVYPERDKKEQGEWDAYFRQHPDHDNIFETASALLTERDPAIIALFGDIRRSYQEGRQEPISSPEMLTLARRYLPEYVPDYPQQYAVTGGMNVEGILLNLIFDAWLEQGSFLGLTREDWMLFTAAEQLILCTLLLQRRQEFDPCALFQTALRATIDPGVQTVLEMFQREPVRLGEPLAQPGRTLSLDGVAALRSPKIIVRTPIDYTCDPTAPELERKIHLIARLFLPAHITMQILWQVSWAELGRSAYLQQSPGGPGPASRLNA